MNFEAVMREAARRREFDRLLKFSVSRDGLPVAWRGALRFMLLISLVDGCRRGARTLPLLMGILNRREQASLHE